MTRGCNYIPGVLWTELEGEISEPPGGQRMELLPGVLWTELELEVAAMIGG